MKYRTKSADVLNEADRLERRLDWQLFCIEQEKRLWSETTGTKWRPGVPMHERPRSEVDPDTGEQYIRGNCVRPMMQTYEYEEDMDDDEEFYGDRCQRVISYPWVDCPPCDVGWVGDEPCWMCGAEYAWKMPRPQKWAGFTRVAPQIVVGDIEMSADGMTFRGRLDISSIVSGFNVASEVIEETGERVAEAFRGFSSHMHIYADADIDLMRLFTGMEAYSIGYNYNPGPIEPYEPLTPWPQPFEREEREIVLVEPVVPILPEWSAYRRPRLEIPSGWQADIFGWIDPRYVPQPRESMDFSDWEYTPYPDATLFERRRR